MIEHISEAKFETKSNQKQNESTGILKIYQKPKNPTNHKQQKNFS